MTSTVENYCEPFRDARGPIVVVMRQPTPVHFWCLIPLVVLGTACEPSMFVAIEHHRDVSSETANDVSSNSPHDGHDEHQWGFLIA
jgi:hypothetical protein